MTEHDWASGEDYKETNFGEFINKRRNDLHFSSTYLGARVGCSGSFISGIERGAQFPSTAMAKNILEALDVYYVETNPLTLKLDNGDEFHFNASVRGRNREAMVEVTMEPGLTNDQIMRIEALNAAVACNSTFVPQTLQEAHHKKIAILHAAEEFKTYIETGEANYA